MEIEGSELLFFWFAHKDVRKYLEGFLEDFDLYYVQMAIEPRGVLKGPRPFSESKLFKVAALHGQLEILKWLKTTKPHLWGDDQICDNAVMNKHLHVVEWARQQDPPAPWGGAGACCYAAKTQNLELLKYVREHGAPLDVCTVYWILKNNNPEMMAWGRENQLFQHFKSIEDFEGEDNSE